MSRFVIVVGLLSVASAGWYALGAVAARTAEVAPAIASGVSAASWAAKEFESCEALCTPSAKKSSAVAAEVKAKGKIIGNFDGAMSGICERACAMKTDYDPAQLAAQPGAKKGQLTQCPVSGVVFKVTAMSGTVKIGDDQYFTCCGSCSQKLQASPEKFVRS